MLKIKQNKIKFLKNSKTCLDSLTRFRMCNECYTKNFSNTVMPFLLQNSLCFVVMGPSCCYIVISPSSPKRQQFFLCRWATTGYAGILSNCILSLHYDVCVNFLHYTRKICDWVIGLFPPSLSFKTLLR